MQMIPTIERIARTINGPNIAENVGGVEKLHELQDIRWGQLKSQEQAQLMRAARYVQELVQQTLDGWLAGGGLPLSSLPPPIPREPPPAAPPPLPGAIKRMPPVDQNTPGDVLRLFRQFVLRNVTQWVMGAGDHHHPIWELVASHVEGEETGFGPDWEFVQPLNREKHAILIEQFLETPIKWDTVPFNPAYAAVGGKLLRFEDGEWKDKDGIAYSLTMGH